jgi:hypothetical protein
MNDRKPKKINTKFHESVTQIRDLSLGFRIGDTLWNYLLNISYIPGIMCLICLAKGTRTRERCKGE